MNASGILIIAAGVLVITQVFKGQALERMGVVS